MRFFKIDTNASADLVAAVAGKKIRVNSIMIFVASEVTVKFQSGATTDLTGAMTLEKGTPLIHDMADDRAGEMKGYFETNPGEKLNVVLGAGIQISGCGTYELVT
jgi:hypothetical protein